MLLWNNHEDSMLNLIKLDYQWLKRNNHSFFIMWFIAVIVITQGQIDSLFFFHIFCLCCLHFYVSPYVLRLCCSCYHIDRTLSNVSPRVAENSLCRKTWRIFWLQATITLRTRRASLKSDIHSCCSYFGTFKTFPICKSHSHRRFLAWFAHSFFSWRNNLHSLQHHHKVFDIYYTHTKVVAES